MKHPAALGFLAMAMALSVLPGTAQAQAQAAYTSTTVHLRAGPGADYPVVAILPAGLQISVQGCVNDYSWCDVAAGPNRGWVYAGYINYYYHNTYVPLLNYGTLIGIGILPFILDDYWGSHYHDRPWYPERDRWADRRAYPPARIHPPQQQRPPGGSGWVAPRPHPPGAAPQQPRPPGAAPQQPRAPGAAPQQPRAPGGAPSVAPRPSAQPAPAPGVRQTPPPSGSSGWTPGSQEPPSK